MEKIRNPLTGRPVLVGGTIYKRLLRDGVIKPSTPKPPIHIEPSSDPKSLVSLPMEALELIGRELDTISLCNLSLASKELFQVYLFYKELPRHKDEFDFHKEFPYYVAAIHMLDGDHPYQGMIRKNYTYSTEFDPQYNTQIGEQYCASWVRLFGNQNTKQRQELCVTITCNGNGICRIEVNTWEDVSVTQKKRQRYRGYFIYGDGIEDGMEKICMMATKGIAFPTQGCELTRCLVLFMLYRFGLKLHGKVFDHKENLAFFRNVNPLLSPRSDV